MRVISVLMLLVLLLSGCSSTPSAKVILRWDGSTLTGAEVSGGWNDLKLAGGVTVHYGLTTSADVADKYGKGILGYLSLHRRLGRLDPSQVVHVWIVPLDVAWPSNVPTPPPFEQARAVAPLNVVAYDQPNVPQGLDKAVAVAATQPAGSPAFTVDWLHEGTGAITQAGWYLFPSLPSGTQEQTLLQELQHPTQAVDYGNAAASLASLLMDRWGVTWTATYDRKPAELTPAQALLWATGAQDEAAALALWKQRREFIATAPSSGMMQDFTWKTSAADMSPIRMQPKLTALPKGPGPNDNYSPHAYAIDVRYDPATRLIGGTERLTWQNGEGIPVDTLYFNLWANAEQFALYGGGISVQQVQVDSKPVAHKAAGLDLQVPLGRAVQPGETAVVEMKFTTRLPGIITVRDFGQEGTARFNLAHWFPSLGVLDDRGWNLHALSLRNAEPYSEVAKFQLKLDLPAGTQLAATGARVGRVEKDGRWIYEYAAENVRDWVATGGTNLREENVAIDGVAVHLLNQDGPWFQATIDELKKSIPFYNQTFGRYPYKDLVVSCCVGMEWPQFIFTEVYTGTSDARGLQRYRYVVHHELGHEWFYGFVGNDQFNEPWMDEGFATYADRSFFRSQGWDPYGGDLTKRPLPPPQHTSYGQNFWVKGGNFSAVYFDGARTLEDLGALVGTATMDRLMKDWVRDYKFKTTTTAAFIQHAQRETGRDLTEFFHQHGVFAEDRELYQPPIPLGQAVPAA